MMSRNKLKNIIKQLISEKINFDAPEPYLKYSDKPLNFNFASDDARLKTDPLWNFRNQVQKNIELGNAGKIILIPLARKIINGPQIPALSTNNLICSSQVINRKLTIPTIRTIIKTIIKVYLYMGFIPLIFFSKMFIFIFEIIL